MKLIPSAEMKNWVPGTTDAFWAQRRYMGLGPKFVKVGRRVFYRPEDLELWINSNVREHT